MVKRRRKAKRSLGRTTFAFLWIVLAGVSGLYLFMLVTDPAALGGQAGLGALAQRSAPAAPPETDTASVPAPPPSAPQAAAPPPPANAATKADLAALKTSLEGLSQQVGQMDSRLKPIEQFIGPVAALPPAPASQASPPAATNAPPEPAAAAAPPPAPPPPAPAVEEVVEEAVVEEAPPPPRRTPQPPAPPPPAETAAPDPAPEPTAAAPSEPAPQRAAGLNVPPPPAAATPQEAPAPRPEPQRAPPPAPAPPQAAAGTPPLSPPSPPSPPTPQVAVETDLAAFDPVMLPPGANDGSTRYGIEIGTVDKRDDLRPLWREYLTEHAALVAGLQPRRVLAPDQKWRLIAGPFANARDAEGACMLFKKAERPCAATVYAGDSL